ncbi:MAG: peptidoglycan DD-metalloendopeptidase family protein [Rhodospirillales bacterium]
MHQLKALICRLFPDRQILVRANDQVRCVTLSRNVQLAAAAGVLALFGWLAVASGMIFALNQSIEARDARLDRQRIAYDKLVGDVAVYRGRMAQVTSALRERQASLLEMFEPGAGTAEPSSGRTARPEDAAAREAVQRHMRRLDGELDAITDLSASLEQNLGDVRRRLSAAITERDQVAAARAELWQRLQDAQRREKGETERNLTLRQTLTDTAQQLGRTAEDRDRAGAERDLYRKRVAELERGIADAQEQQQNLVYRLSERAADSIQDAERIVALTGIKPEWLIGAARQPAAKSQGGPFLPVGRKDPGQEMQSAMGMLDLQLDRWEALQRALRAIPFAPPLDKFTQTSGFGTRVDPFTQTQSMHPGLDLSAPRRTQVYAPAPGVVLFASRKDRYGKLVEIDHGMGIVTRYGHLDEIIVKPGQRVGFRDKIGLVGSTGRTSGAHLHYEVTVKGKPLDPQRFVEVGRYLYKEVDAPAAKTAAAKKPVANRPDVARK